eukprot:COSAG04_NODE_875_length_9692_cov_6.365266_9_plen_251_part_00
MERFISRALRTRVRSRDSLSACDLGLSGGSGCGTPAAGPGSALGADCADSSDWIASRSWVKLLVIATRRCAPERWPGCSVGVTSEPNGLCSAASTLAALSVACATRVHLESDQEPSDQSKQEKEGRTCSCCGWQELALLVGRGGLGCAAVLCVCGYSVIGPTFFRPFLAHFFPVFPHFFAIFSVWPPRFQKPAPRPRKTVRNGRETAAKRGPKPFNRKRTVAPAPPNFRRSRRFASTTCPSQLKSPILIS